MTFRLPSHLVTPNVINTGLHSTSDVITSGYEADNQFNQALTMPATPELNAKELAQADWFMCEEVKRINELLARLCREVEIKSTNYVTFRLDPFTKRWDVNSVYQSEKVGQLIELLAIDKIGKLQENLNKQSQIIDDVCWLQESFEHLARSVELLNFANDYRKDQEQALASYHEIVKDELMLTTEVIYFNNALVWLVKGGRETFYIPA